MPRSLPLTGALSPILRRPIPSLTRSLRSPISRSQRRPARISIFCGMPEANSDSPASAGARGGGPGIVESNAWVAERYEEHGHFNVELSSPVLEILKPAPGESILDLGCGDGALTLKLVDVGCSVVGIDASESMVERARSRGIQAYRMDGHALPFSSSFDAVFSNAALHWMKDDPEAVVAGVRRALRPGGRFVGEFGGFGNCASLVTAAAAVLRQRGVDVRVCHPWYFPSVEEYRNVLEQQNFMVDFIELVPRPTVLPTDVRGWIGTFAHSFLQALPEKDREEAVSDMVTLLTPSLLRHDGKWVMDYVRLRFRAHIEEVLGVTIL
ncbi:unnamed protein product [Ostreobium quekettii]|uniref:Methyltransferase type 11 domain-containing protein n=1 Tax=Ostreobium quekettii TaxID=121088 RepID=A0A8S1J4H3_9CHLO|nr:unnamed protein product [Ostreobium quekettii]